jgi:hypothetical protein
MMSNLLDPDPEFQELDTSELRSIMSRNNESVLRHGRAIMELGRRASIDPALLQEVSGLVRFQGNRRRMTVGVTSVSQLGTAGLVAGGSKEAIGLAAELVHEWHRDEQTDFARLMKGSGIAWPPD